MKRLATMVGVVVAGATLCGAAAGQGYPSKAIRFVVPQSAGSATDTVARAIGVKLSERLGQPVVIDNRAGAGGIVGVEMVAKAPPDGHAIVIVSATHAINPSLRRSLPYDPVKDFAPVTLATQQPSLMIAHPSLPARTLKELVALARSKPGQINYASSGTGSIGHLGLELLKSTARIDMVHVPYKGVIPALNDVMGGHAQLMFITPVTGMPQVKAGRLRALGMSGLKRAPSFPDIPTVAEQGFPGFDVTGWYAILAPAGTPAAVIGRLNSEIVAILQSPDIRERLVNDGSEAVGGTPEQLGQHLRSEVAKWAKVVKGAGLKPE